MELINEKIIEKFKNNKLCSEYEYVLYFDGCSKGNPGLAGIGVAIYKNNELLITKYKYLINNATNNEAEYNALILGMELALEKNIDILLICGDSQLIINQVIGKYKVKSENLIELNNYVNKLKESFLQLEFKHIYREENKLADYLANYALKIRN